MSNSKINELKRYISQTEWKQEEQDQLKELLKEIVISEKYRPKFGLIYEEQTENIVENIKKGKIIVSELEDKRIIKEAKTGSNDAENLIIEGDNLITLLKLKEANMKVDLIYIDPPYNSKNKDFIFNDEYVNINDEWRHSKWLSFMDKRLRLAKDLVKDDGAVFISIDETEFAQLKLLCDSIFNEKNFVDCLIWNKRVPKNDKGIGNIHEYILLYTKNVAYKYKFMMDKNGLDEIFDLMEKCKRKKLSIEESTEKLRNLYEKNSYDRGITLYNEVSSDYRPWGKINVSWPNSNTFGPTYEVLHPITKKPVKMPDRGWRWKTFDDRLDDDNLIVRSDGSVISGSIWFAKDENTQPSSIKFLDEVDRMLLRSVISVKSDGGVDLEKIFGNKSVFSYPKSVKLIRTLIDSFTYNRKDAVILDFFAGSGTTAQAIMELNDIDNGNRKSILCTNNENNICEEITYPRVSKIMNGYIGKKGKKISPISGNLIYLKTEVKESSTIDEELISEAIITSLREEMNPFDIKVFPIENKIFNKENDFIAVAGTAEKNIVIYTGKTILPIDDIEKFIHENTTLFINKELETQLTDSIHKRIVVKIRKSGGK